MERSFFGWEISVTTLTTTYLDKVVIRLKQTIDDWLFWLVNHTPYVFLSRLPPFNLGNFYSGLVTTRSTNLYTIFAEG